MFDFPYLCFLMLQYRECKQQLQYLFCLPKEMQVCFKSFAFLFKNAALELYFIHAVYCQN